MKRDDGFKRLDRAFTQAPPELHDQVELAFLRGESAMKKRHKLAVMLSAAAAFAVLCAALALAAGTLVRPCPDNVAVRGGSNEGSSESAVKRANTTESDQVEAPVYYYTEEGQFYHADAHCSGMMNAREHSLADALHSGKQPCPVCVYDGTAVYYATKRGEYFHTDENCSGMKDAWPMALDAAWISKKTPCPLCVDASEIPHLWLYYSEEGAYYHLSQDCSGTHCDLWCTPVAMELRLKKPCPACVPESLFEFCWATPFGSYYHIDRECMGMRDARVYTKLYAEQYSGKKPCPVCWE